MRYIDAWDGPLVRELIARDEFFWLDLDGTDAATIAKVGEVFGLHELAIEDSMRFGQRPKLDEYDSFALLVYFGLRAGASVTAPELVEVHMYVHGRGVVTLRDGDVPELAALRARVADLPSEHERVIVHRILDALTDSFFPVLDQLDDEIDRIEDAVLGDVSLDHRNDIFDIKRSLMALRRIVAPQRDLLARADITIDAVPGLGEESSVYFRDLYDHMLRIADMLDTYRDLLAGMMDLHLTTVANRQNEQMKTLTVIATVFLPLTFVTGFFGQNFGWMVDQVGSLHAFLTWGIGSLVLSVVALVAFFARRGYFR